MPNLRSQVWVSQWRTLSGKALVSLQWSFLWAPCLERCGEELIGWRRLGEAVLGLRGRAPSGLPGAVVVPLHRRNLKAMFVRLASEKVV